MSERPQCWSFSLSGERCELKAGHTADHKVTHSWDDGTVWVPTMPPPAQMATVLPFTTTNAAQVQVNPPIVWPEVIEVDDPPVGKGKCVVCNHRAVLHGEEGCSAKGCECLTPVVA